MHETAYDMRISDWSSDVCSSDLPPGCRERRGRDPPDDVPRIELRSPADRRARGGDRAQDHQGSDRGSDADADRPIGTCSSALLRKQEPRVEMQNETGLGLYPREQAQRHHIHRCHKRSEEHTSELQSLMRLSYAVFSLTKKNNTQ